MFSVAGVGIGSSVPDMDTMFSETRYVSNIDPNLGGSVNTSVYTGLGSSFTIQNFKEIVYMYLSQWL